MKWPENMCRNPGASSIVRHTNNEATRVSTCLASPKPGTSVPAVDSSAICCLCRSSLPAPSRRSSNAGRQVVSSCRALPRVTSDSNSNNNRHHEDSKQTTEKEAPPSWSVASRTAAACLATAAILSSSLPAGAGVVGGHLDTRLLPGRGAVPASAVMLLADEGDSTSSDGRADVSDLVSELKRADRADLVLNSMVKINDVVDADEDGVLENPFAAEVRCLE